MIKVEDSRDSFSESTKDCPSYHPVNLVNPVRYSVP